MRKRLKTLIPNNFNMQTAYNGRTSNNVLKPKTQSILNTSTILFILETALLITVMMITLVRQVEAFQKG